MSTRAARPLKVLTPPSSIRAASVNGVAWTFLQVWFNRLSTAAAFVVLSRQLQPADFGLVGLSMSIIAVLAVMADSGLASFVIRAPQVTPRMLSTAFWTTLVLAVGLASVVAGFSGLLATAFDEPGLVAVLLWLTTSLVLTGLGSVPAALLKREMRFKDLAARGMTATIVSSVAGIVLALAGAGVWALVVQTLLRGAISTVMTWTASRWYPSWSWDRSEARQMLSFGSKLLGIDLMVQSRDRGQDFIIAGVMSTTSLGLWAVANRLVRLVTETCSSVIQSVATPAFSKLQGDKERLFRGYAIATSSAGALLYPTLLFLAVTSPDLVPFVLGEQWRTSAQLAQVAALTALVTSFSYFDRSIFVSLGEVRAELKLVAVSVVLQLLVVIATVQWGLMVMAVALLARGLLVVPLRFVTLHRVTGMPYGALIRPLRVLLPALLMAAAAFLAVETAPVTSGPARVAVAAAVCAVTYPPLLWVFAGPVVRDMTADVKRVVSSRRSRRRVVEPATPAGAR